MPVFYIYMPFASLACLLHLYAMRGWACKCKFSKIRITCCNTHCNIHTHTHARHNTTSTRGTHSSNAPCAHDKWREKPTLDGARNPHPACGVSSRNPHPASGVDSNCDTLQHAQTISLPFLSLCLPPSLSLSLSLSFTDLHTHTHTHART